MTKNINISSYERVMTIAMVKIRVRRNWMTCMRDGQSNLSSTISSVAKKKGIFESLEEKIKDGTVSKMVKLSKELFRIFTA